MLALPFIIALIEHVSGGGGGGGRGVLSSTDFVIKM